MAQEEVKPDLASLVTEIGGVHRGSTPNETGTKSIRLNHHLPIHRIPQLTRLLVLDCHSGENSMAPAR